MKRLFSILAILFASFALVGCGLSATDTANVTTNSDTRVFTLTELSQYTGLNGTEAYIAVGGVVYDVSNVFVHGSHQGMQLGGTDCTAVFASSPHSASLLNTLPVMGVIGDVSYNPALVTESVSTSAVTTTQTTTQTTTAVNTGTTLPVFTLTELANYTGVNGSTAYIAVNGVVYDVTNAFVNGTHQGMQLGGTDATAVFASSPHSQATLNSLTVVGSLEGYPTITVSSTTTTSTNTSTSTNHDDDDDDDENEDEYEDD
ncbi:MAG: cytochrome b5 domain-containing protein [Candidatus Izemoplasmatales bacterium]